MNRAWLAALTFPAMTGSIVAQAPPAPSSPVACFHQPGGDGQPAQDHVGADDRFAARAQNRARAMDLERRAIAAFNEGLLAQAEALLREQLTLQPGHFVVTYNLACVRAAAGDHDDGMRLLVQAIEEGFDDLRTMDRDPSLAPLRGRGEYREIRERWSDILDARRDANVASVLDFFSGDYRVHRDDRLRLLYVTAVRPSSADAAREEISRLGEWACREIFPGLLDPPESAHDPWVVVVLPTPGDFGRWIASRHGASGGAGLSSIGGEYDHDMKILVARDLGSSLRHEFFHVLHWRSCMRLGQRHAIWVQEGLGTLVEDYDTGPAPDGDIILRHSWRTNIVKRLERAGRLAGLSDLCSASPDGFMSMRVLASYARARSAFLYLAHHGKIREWYERYTAGFERDRTGRIAWEETFGTSMATIDRDYRAWVRSIEMVPEEIGPGMASLGVEVESGEADGLVITRVVDPRRDGDGRLRQGDVMTDIDGRPTRDIAELVRVLSGYRPGDRVTVGLRRGSRVRTETVTLIARS